MADVLRLMRRLKNKKRKQRVPRRWEDRMNPLEVLSDNELYQRYRFRRATIIFLVDMVGEAIRHETRRSNSLPPLLQVLIFLQFVATGAFHILVGQALRVSKATAGRSIRNVAEAICQHSGKYIKFPSGQRLHDVKRAFHAIAGE